MTSHLGARRYCARCGTETVWTNEHDGGLVFQCAIRPVRVEASEGVFEERLEPGCGLTATTELTPGEFARLLAREARYAPPPQRAWRFV